MHWLIEESASKRQQHFLEKGANNQTASNEKHKFGPTKHGTFKGRNAMYLEEKSAVEPHNGC